MAALLKVQIASSFMAQNARLHVPLSYFLSVPPSLHLSSPSLPVAPQHVQLFLTQANSTSLLYAQSLLRLFQ